MVVIHAAGVTTPRVRHRSPLLRSILFLKTVNPCWAAGSLRPAPTRRLRSWLLTLSTRCTTDVPTPMVRPIFTLPHALGVQLRGRRGNAANGVPGEGRQFQLQSGQGRQRTTARPAFADTHASSTARRNSLSSVTWLGESAAIGHSPRGVFFDGTVLPSRTSRNRLPADCRYGVTTAVERSTALC